MTVGAGVIAPASYLAGVLIPSPDSSSAINIQSSSTIFRLLSVFILLVGGVGSGSITPISVDGADMGITWSAGSTGSKIEQSQLALMQSSIPR